MHVTQKSELHDHPHLAPTPGPSSAPGRQGPSYHWDKTKVACLGYLVGLGFSAPQIAEVMGCSQSAVANACSRYRLTMNRRRDGSIVIPAVLSKETAAVLEESAYLRAIKRKELVERVLALIGAEGEGFVANILDDAAI